MRSIVSCFCLGVLALGLVSCETYKDLRTPRKLGAPAQEEDNAAADRASRAQQNAQVNVPIGEPALPIDGGWRVPDMADALPTNDQTAPAIVKPDAPRQDDVIVPGQ